MQHSGDEPEQLALTREEVGALTTALPRPIQDLLIRNGRSVFRHGRVQLCHPHDLAIVMDLLLAEDPDLEPAKTHAYAYSAFGIIYFVHEMHGAGQVDLLTDEMFCSGLQNDNNVGPHLLCVLSTRLLCASNGLISVSDDLKVAWPAVLLQDVSARPASAMVPPSPGRRWCER